MPDYERPVTSSDEAAEHARALAHATRWFDSPGDTYWVTGDVLAITRRLRGVLVNVASAHMRYRELAHVDDGNAVRGGGHADDAAMLLRRASMQLEHVEALIDEAQAHSGQIAWHAPTAATENELPQPPPPRRAVADMAARRARSVRDGLSL